jgi:tol-pal system protein YbgF
VQSLDAKISGGGAGATPTGASNSGSGMSAQPASSSLPPSGAATGGGSAPSADTLYSNGLRDITGGNYDLARKEFQDYLKYYGDTDLASNAQFYLGEIAYKQKQYQQAVSEFDKVLTNYPRSFKLQPAHLRKGMALIELGQKTQGVRELRDVIRHNPNTDEDRLARAKLKELGVAVTAPAGNH